MLIEIPLCCPKCLNENLERFPYTEPDCLLKPYEDWYTQIWGCKSCKCTIAVNYYNKSARQFLQINHYENTYDTYKSMNDFHAREVFERRLEIDVKRKNNSYLLDGEIVMADKDSDGIWHVYYYGINRIHTEYSDEEFQKIATKYYT